MPTKQWRQVWVGMGSNLGQPVQHLLSAQQQLTHAEYVKHFRISSFYQSKPVGPQDQPDFVNAVCSFNTHLPPEQLFVELQSIELAHGRIKKRHWGERTLDLDILLYADKIINQPNLTIPHPEMLNRSFVIYPALEINPALTMPNRQRIAEMSLPQNDLTRLKTNE
jgi:2-amino-4-hydroxy-6-hydroxymethyldihydropteridine diphosphokinase